MRNTRKRRVSLRRNNDLNRRKTRRHTDILAHHAIDSSITVRHFRAVPGSNGRPNERAVRPPCCATQMIVISDSITYIAYIRLADTVANERVLLLAIWRVKSSSFFLLHKDLLRHFSSDWPFIQTISDSRLWQAEKRCHVSKY